MSELSHRPQTAEIPFTSAGEPGEPLAHAPFASTSAPPYSPWPFTASWHVLDKAIDKALAALRANSPNQADRKAAMANLLKTFDTLRG